MTVLVAIGKAEREAGEAEHRQKTGTPEELQLEYPAREV